MPVGMARAIYEGSKKGTLTIGGGNNDYEWLARFSITTVGPNAGTHTQDVVIGGGDAEFSISGNTLSFETASIIEVDNDESLDTSDWTIDNLTLYIRELGQTDNKVVVPQTTINVTIEPLQALRITEITLEVND